MTHRYPKEGESFADYYPDKISIWGVKNTLTPFDYCKSSGEKIWWTCPNGHEDYLSSIYHVGSGTGCSECGYTDKLNRENQADFLCKKCGHTMNADLNAAINILGRY